MPTAACVSCLSRDVCHHDEPEILVWPEHCDREIHSVGAGYSTHSFQYSTGNHIAEVRILKLALPGMIEMFGGGLLDDPIAHFIHVAILRAGPDPLRRSEAIPMQPDSIRDATEYKNGSWADVIKGGVV
jgi:hypothetical protein